MNLEELGFFNRQLGAMIESGVPLEGALLQITRTMRRGELRTEIERLEADLRHGCGFEEALQARRFPPLYKGMLATASKVGSLPRFLTLLADHYHRAARLGNRLQGLLFYPALVLAGSLCLSVWFAYLFGDYHAQVRGMSLVRVTPNTLGTAAGVEHASLLLALWIPPVTIALLGLLLGLGLGLVPVREWLRWRLPAFREAALAHLASNLEVLVRGGTPLPLALEFLEGLEPGAGARREMARWRSRAADGHGTFQALTVDTRLLPPLFLWLVASSGEALADGFQRAAELYERRAMYQMELLLQAVLPGSLLVLGVMMIGQVAPFLGFMNELFGGLSHSFSVR